MQINKTDEGQWTIKELFELMATHYKRKLVSELCWSLLFSCKDTIISFDICFQKANFEKTSEDMRKEWKAGADTIPEVYENIKKMQKKSLD